MTPVGRKRDFTEVTAPLPPGFLVVGALKGLFKSPRSTPVLPQRALYQHCRVEPDTVDRLARVCAMTPSQGVPLTLPYVLSFPLQMRLMMAKDFPYPPVGMVHLHNRIRQTSRLRVGERLTLVCQAGQWFSHPKGSVFSLEIHATHEGLRVWDCTSYYLKRGGMAQGPGLPVLESGGASEPVATWAANGRTARAYARVSGDANPIHTSRAGARILGFKQALAHGMWTKARALSALLPPDPVDVAEAEVSFRNPLFLPGQAELYASQTGPVRTFECRDPTGAQTYLRGRLSLI